MDHIYQASDLASKRRELLDSAREGIAQIRDSDGTALVLIPQGTFDLLRAHREQLARFLALEAALERPASQRQVTDFGEFAWLVAFDADDQQSFRRELMGALVQSLAGDSTEPVERCVREWRISARALSNEKSRRILTPPGAPDSSFEQVERPERE